MIQTGDYIVENRICRPQEPSESGIVGRCVGFIEKDGVIVVW